MCRKEEETVENVETGGERIYVETEGEKMYRKDEEKVDTGGVNVETGVEMRQEQKEGRDRRRTNVKIGERMQRQKERECRDKRRETVEKGGENRERRLEGLVMSVEGLLCTVLCVGGGPLWCVE